eukprot:c14834_g1_i1.p1 GENE.c14834_g1_i1~~c14834_g1_i1.p1  ORF type:complete len:193 (-),score=66.72 c14834_g1_i1:25-549(-)
METHSVLQKKGYDVESFGTGNNVKLPGKTAATPNVYEFGVPYQFIFEELKAKDIDLYTHNGVLQMLERNARLKLAPQKFQKEPNMRFDFIVTFSETVFDQVIEDLLQRPSIHHEPIYILNFTVKDTHEDAAIGAVQIGQLCQRLSETDKDRWESVILDFGREQNKVVFLNICFS